MHAEIAIRNASKEKLASTQSLEIKLSKFSGYNSSVDIYTFQSEFEKLYLPSLQKKLIPDFLKNKYLEGHYLVLLKNIEDLGMQSCYSETNLKAMKRLVLSGN